MNQVKPDAQLELILAEEEVIVAGAALTGAQDAYAEALHKLEVLKQAIELFPTWFDGQ